MTALLLINFQIDFFEGGSVGTDAGKDLVELANRLMPRYDRVVAVRDWHPAEHVSFASTHLWRRPGQVMRIGEREQLLWHMHCVQDSFGAEWVPGLNISAFDKVVDKGTDPMTDGYSGFEGTDLEVYLETEGVTKVDLLGVPEDYDVKYTAEDAERLGFESSIVQGSKV